MRALAVLALIAGCDRPAIASCGDDLRGVYASGDRRWMVLDSGATLEIYPLFDDVAPVPGFEVAPRAIDLARTPSALAGDVRRRYLRGTERCEARVPARITACANDELELVLADPEPPTATAPCAWPHTGPSRRERWIRVR